MEGKKTLYQRVITHPGAAAHEAAGGPPGKPIIPFSVMYVYARGEAGGQGWIQAAGNTQGQDLAWVPAQSVSEWKQSLALTFAERAGRSPVLFFKASKDLENIAGQGGITAALRKLAETFQAFVRGREAPPGDFPVVAMEPGDDEGAVPYDRFYLIPIFNYQEPFEGVKFLEVGSIDPGEAGEGGQGGSGGQEGGDGRETPLKNAVAFVVDTTQSMGPYIDKTLEITRSVYDRILELGQGENVALGLVAFRNSLEAKPNLEYTSRVVSPLRKALERKELEEALAKVKEAGASTHSFSEDSLAGVKTAIDELDWDEYKGRVIILVTDAGPLPITDPYVSTMLSLKGMADRAKKKNIRLVVLHIRTPDGAKAKNHDYAEAAYKELSDMESAGRAYIPLEANDTGQGTDNFAVAAEALLKALEGAVFKPGSRDQAAGADKTVPEGADLKTTARALGEVLGYSIKLDYAGQVNKSRAPRVVRSWVADQDMGRLDEARGAAKSPAMVCNVLLSREQLNALSRHLSIIMENAERTQLMGTRDFFQGVLAASAQMVQDPSRLNVQPGITLSDLGGLGEFLEGLPYKSRIMGLTEEDWYNMSIGQQNDFIYYLKDCLQSYRDYYDDLDHWGKFSGPANSNDWLYRVPLSRLP
jgi:serine/threonine-protein kinase PpkA